jgi:acyl dehydratase
VFESVVGRSSAPVTNWVERGAVRRFAEAIGDLNPLYFDDAIARASSHGRLIAPPTFPVTLDYGTVPGFMLPPAGIIHGSQSFRYSRPLFVGDKLECDITLETTFVKAGSQGRLTFLVLRRSGRSAGGAEIFVATATLIITETVMRGLAQ